MADPYVMKRTRHAFVHVVGMIWMPAVVSVQTYGLTDYDLDSIGEFTRENVEQWLSTHAGDFQSITDFYAVCGDTVIDWADEESDSVYWDCMLPPED